MHIFRQRNVKSDSCLLEGIVDDRRRQEIKATTAYDILLTYLKNTFNLTIHVQHKPAYLQEGNNFSPTILSKYICLPRLASIMLLK